MHARAGTSAYYPDAGAEGQILVAGMSDDLDWHFTSMDLATGKVLSSARVEKMVIMGLIADHATNRTWVAGFLQGGSLGTFNIIHIYIYTYIHASPPSSLYQKNPHQEKTLPVSSR